MFSFVKGDSFTAGQVLLQIETDKAQMDLEAPDDGIMGKILVSSGSDNVIVGSPIAILAEEGDDLSNLSIPEKKSDAPIQPKKEEIIKSPISQEKIQIESHKEISSALILTKSVVDSLNKFEMLPEFANVAVFTSASGNSSPILLSSDIVLQSSPESLEAVLKGSNHNSASLSANIAVVIGLSTSNIAEISKKYETVVSIGNSYKLFSSDERQSILSGALDSILLKPSASTNAQKSTSSLAVDVLINSRSKKINHDAFLSSIKSSFSKLG
ncbi:putative pyruvate dehydrogenase protein X component, mitochondrial [Smittium culicis]|uniref:Putative pyruvate dehydrogenase protein X component, mitochondrial n=1 Tax=Smittium culicis TaxID=133412 RepID=A0A1R1YJ37_9FUNG|nr:putative pyruvate dehydrogenase protein X component, mitochondrial [Smittium culicis]